MDLQGQSHSVCQADGASDMAPAYWLCWGRGSAKGQWPLLTPMPGTSVSPCIALVDFKLPPWCWSSEGMSLNRCMGFPEGQLRAPAASSTNSILVGFCSQKLWGLVFLALESGLGALVCVWNSLLLRYLSRLLSTWVLDQPILHSHPSY